MPRPTAVVISSEAALQAVSQLAARLDAPVVTLPDGAWVEEGNDLSDVDGAALVILALMPTEAFQPRAIADTDLGDWHAACSHALKATFLVMKALHGRLRESGGATIVLLGPHLAMSGAANLVALTALAEGQRALMKSLARQWAADGFAVHWAGMDSGALSGGLNQTAIPRKSDPISVALGKAPELTALAPLLETLAQPETRRAFTGATLMFDGGEWMVP